MRVGVPAHEESVVFAFAPTESRDRTERLVGITVLPSCPNESMCLEVRRPIGEPMQLGLALADGGVPAQRIAPQGLEGIRREVEVSPAHRVFA